LDKSTATASDQAKLFGGRTWRGGPSVSSEGHLPFGEIDKRRSGGHRAGRIDLRGGLSEPRGKRDDRQPVYQLTAFSELCRLVGAGVGIGDCSDVTTSEADGGATAGLLHLQALRNATESNAGSAANA